jgi:hypothetical protein
MTDILIPYSGKNVIVDATMLTNIMKCARFTNFKHGMNLVPMVGKSNSLEVGSIIHKFLEVYYKTQKQGIGRTQAVGYAMAAAELYIQGCPDCTDFKPHPCPCNDGAGLSRQDCHVCNGKGEITKPTCGHPVNEYPGLQCTPAETEGYVIGWKFALQTCDEYVKFWSNDSWVTLDVEIVKSKILYQDDEIRVLFKSKLDWIVDTTDGIYPCDHKTMKQNRDTLSINNQFMGQCRQLDVNRVFVNKIGLQKTLKPLDKFKRVPIYYSNDRLLEWQSEVLPYWCKQLLVWNEQGYYPANFTNCESKFGKCEFYNVCEANPNMRQEELQINFKVGDEWNPTNSVE